MTNPTWAGVTIDPALLQNYGWYVDTVTVDGVSYNRLIGYMAAALSEQASQLANAGSALVATSSTNSVAIGTGTKTLTVASPSTKGFSAGMYVVAVDAANSANAITGRVTSYNTTTGALVISVPTGGTTGSGTPSSWVIGISGAVGPTGATGPTTTFWGGTAGGTANALTATTGSSLSSLTAGQVVWLKTGASANSGATTLAVDSVGAKAVQKNGSALVSGDLPASTTIAVMYDGAAFQLLSVSGGAGGALWCGVATGTANALTLTPSTALSAYSNGVSISFVTSSSDNSGAVTVAVSGLSAVSLYSVSGFALNARDLKANTLYQATYYSGAFRLLGTPAAGSITTTGLVSRIDAGDSACYSTGQTLTNLVSVPADGAASSSYSWVRGASTSAGSDDPTFNGSPGGMSSSEYFSTDGGDLLSLAAGSNTTWLDGLHKAGATGTIAAWIYPTGTFVIFGTCDQSNRPGIFFRVTPGTPETNFAVFGDSGLAAASPSSTTTSANAWSFAAISFAEGVTNGSFYYINGNYAQVSSSNTFTLSYSSPSVNAANRKAAWFEYGTNTGGNTASGSRHAQGFLYNRALSKAELDAIFAATRARYGV